MSEVIQELPDFDGVYDSYEGRRSEIIEEELVPQEQLNFENKKMAQDRINELAQVLEVSFCE